MKHSNKVDMRFKYVPAAATDIRKTIRAEQQRLKAEAEAQKNERAEKVRSIKATKA